MKKSVGQLLRSTREQLGIRLEDAARETHIRLNYLQELENDHPELLHSATQARGFLRLYATFLKISPNELIEQWEESVSDKQKSETGKEKPDQETPKQEVREEKKTRKKQPVAEKPDSPKKETKKSRQETDKPSVRLVDGFKKIIEHFSQNDLMKKILERISVIRREKPSDKGEENVGPLPKQHQQSSEDIFKEIGQALQSRRQMMQLSLSDIENFTNLKRMYLVAIEDGRFGDLPSTVQGRGMLNNYAKFLGMDESAVMDQYGQALQIQREERLANQRKPMESPITVKLNLPENWRKIINPDLLIGGALILGLFAFIIWGASQVLRGEAGSPTEAPSISEMLQITPSLSPSPDLTQMAGTEQPAEEATALPGVAIIQSTPTTIATVNAAPLQLYIIANDRSYVKVTVDGKEAFNGRVLPDNAYTYSGNERINLIAGNGAALEVYFNQEYIGKLGSVGEVVNINFTLEGLKTPTPQTTLTPTVEILPEEIEATLSGE